MDVSEPESRKALIAHLYWSRPRWISSGVHSACRQSAQKQIKLIVMQHWSLINNQPPIISYKKGKIHQRRAWPKMSFEGDNATRPQKPHGLGIDLFLLTSSSHECSKLPNSKNLIMRTVGRAKTVVWTQARVSRWSRWSACSAGYWHKREEQRTWSAW